MILTYIPFFGEGGIESVYLSSIEYEKDKNNHILLTHRKIPSDINEKLNKHSVIVITIPDIKKGVFHYIKNINEILSKYSISIIKTHNYMRSIFLLFLASLRKTPVRIYEAHQFLPGNLSYDFFNIINIKLATKLVAVSSDVGNDCFKDRQYNLIPNGIFTEKYQFDLILRYHWRKKLKQESCIILGTVGRLAVEKNQIFLIELIEQLPPKYCLVIVGEGPERENIEKEIVRKKLKNRVFLLGAIDAKSVYNAFDIFLLPSYTEGQGIVIMEALANGLTPIINKNMNSVFEKDIDVIGLELNVDVWAQEILRTEVKLSNQRLLDGKKQKDKNFDIGSYCKRMEEIYDSSSR